MTFGGLGVCWSGEEDADNGAGVEGDAAAGKFDDDDDDDEVKLELRLLFEPDELNAAPPCSSK